MLIGKTITIKEARNKSIQGMHGVVIDETKHTLRIHTNNETKTIIKEQIITIEETS